MERIARVTGLTRLSVQGQRSVDREKWCTQKLSMEYFHDQIICDSG